jgi:hypothetical protein
MNRKLGILGLLAAMLSLFGCAINQTVRPVEQLESQQLCVVENPAVGMDFLPVFQRTLIDAGYVVRKLSPSSALTDCPVTITYTANWRWDLAMYMAFAEIKVYRDGQLAGQATYDSLHGGANMNKFIKADAKIGELVHQLLPGGPPKSSRAVSSEPQALATPTQAAK